MWQTIQDIFTQIPGAIAFLANFVTFVLGSLAIWGLIYRRDKLSLVFRIFVNAHLGQRVNRLKETLGKMEHLNYEIKENRAELNALIDLLCGQVKSLVGEYPKLANIYDELIELVDRKKRLSEPKKRRIIFELH